MWEYGLLDHWGAEAFRIPNAEKCFVARRRKSTEALSIKLVDLTGAFLILGIGLCAGMLSFLFELIAVKYCHYEMNIVQKVENKIQPMQPVVNSASGVNEILPVIDEETQADGKTENQPPSTEKESELAVELK